MSGTPDAKTLVQGIYYARLLPELSATIAATTSSAKVSAKGQNKTTNALGSAKLTISGSAGDRVKVTITHPGYRSLTVSVKL